MLLTGLAGLLAGSLSMGAGEFISVRSQRELLAAAAPSRATAAAVAHLDVVANELALVYRARGMSPAQAEDYAASQLRTGRAIEEPGETDEHEIVGRGLSAAVSSFAFFATGALVPVLPFLFGLREGAALVVAIVLVAAALMLTGATVGLLSGGPPLLRALRQLAVGTVAAGVTYGLGLLFGAALG